MNQPPANQPSYARRAAFLGFLLLLYALVFAAAARYFSRDEAARATETAPRVFVDGGVFAEVYTWLDLNGDGLRDAGEPPLPGVGVVILEGSEYPVPEAFARLHSSHTDEGEVITDENGRAHPGIFMPGGCGGDCVHGYLVAVEVPVGYRPTTPVVAGYLPGTPVPFTESGIPFYKFGFQKIP